METVVIQPKHTNSKVPDLRWVEKISRIMDSKYSIPGTKIRFGLDPLLSLIPVLGDIATYIISGVLIYTMHNYGASRKLVIKMAINATLDMVIGAIPIVGSIFDIFYKANERNVRLLKEHYQEGKHTGSGKGLLIGVVCVLIVVTAAILYVVWRLLEAFFEFLF